VCGGGGGGSKQRGEERSKSFAIGGTCKLIDGPLGFRKKMVAREEGEGGGESRNEHERRSATGGPGSDSAGRFQLN